jgi:hypothetical protein
MNPSRDPTRPTRVVFRVRGLKISTEPSARLSATAGANGLQRAGGIPSVGSEIQPVTGDGRKARLRRPVFVWITVACGTSKRDAYSSSIALPRLSHSVQSSHVRRLPRLPPV